MAKIDASKRGRVSALDVFVVILLVLCVAGLIVRIAVGKEGILPEGAPEKSEWAVGFEVSSLRASSGGDIAAGDVFYTEDGDIFGTVGDQVSVTPAKIFTEDEDGKLVLTYSGAEGGDNSLVDIKGTMTVEGYTVDYGFLAGGKTLATPGSELALHTDRATFTVKILDIAGLS